MKDILSLPNRELKKHIKTLAADYLEKTGRRVCLSCGADVQHMINTLKTYYAMTQFELTKPNGIYKIQQGSSKTISNNNMSDELALEFLSKRKERIDLFTKYPEDWEKQLEAFLGGVEEAKVVEAQSEEKSDEEVLREQLSAYKMTELREMYPDIKATSKADFIDKIIND